ncbi:MAG TPA: cytochrome P450 [Candidatus Acidoferrales bacterium]|nr:cytochrome P450 [Candidatus Acidoferrales bacterium]
MKAVLTTELDPAAAPPTPDALLSLHRLLDPEVLADPYPLFAALRTQDPVHWDPFLHAWVVTRYADVVTVLREFSAARTPTPEQLDSMGLACLDPVAQVMVKQMLFLDPPAHGRIRSLAACAFTPQRVAALRDRITQLTNELLDAAEDRGSMEVMQDLAEPLPAIVTSELLGLPIEFHRQIKSWSADFAEMLGNFQHNPDRVPKMLAAVENLAAFFRQVMREHAEHPREGLVGSMMSAEVEGDRLSEDEVVANAIITLVGGLETTTNLIGNGILTLLRHPDQLQRLQQDPSLIASAVEELLRFESPSQHTARLAPADVTLGGKLIRERQAVIAVMAAGNRDPERFPEPDRLDLSRQDNRHLAFGWASHFCFGAPLARLEGQIVLGSVVSRFPKLALAPAPIVWRCNLGLRGLTKLRVGLDGPADSVAA